jgi:hypothetical protein
MRKVVALVVVIAALAMPGAALAQGSSTCQTYNPQLCLNATAQKSPAANSASTLPFTGLDAILLAAGGAMLLGAGLVVRVLSRRLN